MEFGARLKAARERAGLSQNALARLAGLSPATINRLESGERGPSNRTLVEQICDALGLRSPERDELLASAGHNPDVYETVPPSDPTLVAIARVLADPGLTPEDKEEFRAVLSSLARRWQGSRTQPGGEE